MIHLRHIPMDALENARDLGGYATADGGVTRYGVFLRSELPENLSEADIALLRRYNVVRSVDLRGLSETVTEPSDLAGVPGIEYVSLPMFDRAAAAGSASERRPEPPKDFKFPDWNVTYVKMLETHKDWPKPLMEAMAGPDGCVHFNCYTGKDRTGLCAAMLLSIAGVSREDICADYSLSMAYLGRRYAVMAERFAAFAVIEDGRPALSGGFFATLPTYMRRTLEHLDSAYDGMVPYLRACGVAEETMARIREKLVARPA
ncbi:MAG: tyrosine-protein phosphatase [Clostridia bacterium]|nr:tyrosine-protein phosphatase [Clostridia bacterium]